MTWPPGTPAPLPPGPLVAGSPGAPPPGSPALAAVPDLVFEVRVTLGTVTTAGFVDSGRVEVVVHPGPALRMQRDLGVDVFAALQTLVMAAEPSPDGRLVFAGGAAELATHLGWGRNKASSAMSRLETAGLVSRQQDKYPGPDGRLRYGRAQVVLSRSLFRAVSRRNVVTHVDSDLAATDSDHRAGSAAPVPCSAEEPASSSVAPVWGDGPAVTAASAASDPGSPGEPAGHTAAAMSGTADQGSIHGDGDDDEPHPSPQRDDHPSPVRPGRTPLLRNSKRGGDPALIGETLGALVGDRPGDEPTRIAGMTRPELLRLLASWKVYDAADLIADTDPDVLEQALYEISDRWNTPNGVRNPGGYLRSLLDKASPDGPLPPPRRASVAPATPAVPVSGSPVADPPDQQRTVTDEEIAHALARLAPEDRSALDAHLNSQLPEHLPPGPAEKMRRAAQVMALAERGLLDLAG